VHLSLQNKSTIHNQYITLQSQWHGFIILCCTWTTFRLHWSGLAVIIQYSDIHKIRSADVHLQQPVDVGALSRLRSTPCERGGSDTPGSFFGNFFARYKCALRSRLCKQSVFTIKLKLDGVWWQTADQSASAGKVYFQKCCLTLTFKPMTLKISSCHVDVEMSNCDKFPGMYMHSGDK